jgi:hypothetical protein
MNGELVIELVKQLVPAGSAAVVLAILAYRSPQLLKEFFAGVGRLLVTMQKIRCGKEGRKLGRRAHPGSGPSRAARTRG